MKKRRLFLSLLGLCAIVSLASCKNKEYTVTFNTNGGSNVAEVVVAEDGFITNLSDPTKEGYTFAGWYLDAAFATRVKLDEFAVTGDVTLYAKWVQNSYKVTFNSNGGSSVAEGSVKHGEVISLPETNPTKEGHEFAGWFTDQALTTQYTTQKITANTTLYAKWNANTYTITFNSNGGSEVSSSSAKHGEVITLPEADPTKEGFTFSGWFIDEALTTQYASQPATSNTTLYAKWIEEAATVYTVTFNTDGGSVIEDQKVTEDDWGYFTVQKPADPTKPYKTFDGWYKDAECTQPFDFTNDEISSDITLYAKWASLYEEVTTSADFDTAAQAYPGKAKPTEDVTFGKFTFGAGVYFEEAGSRPACVNNQQKDITFNLSGRSNSVNFGVRYGSSSGTGVITLYKLNESGEKVEVQVWTNSDNSNITTYSAENLEAGTYVFGSTGSFRFYSIEITEELEQSAPVGLQIASMPQVNFLEGREFNNDGLEVYLVYENGRKDVLSSDKYTLDSSAYVKGTPGTYAITISNEEFQTSYNVVVYDAQSIKVADHVLDSKRVTHPLETVFLVNSTFSSNNLAVSVVAINVDTNETVEFVLNGSEYTISEPSMTAVGAQTVTVTAFETLTDSYEINIVDNVLNVEADKVTINVDAAATVSVSNEGVTFKSINDALRYLELCAVSDETIKVINIAAGSYYEKVEVSLPNVHLIGSNNESLETVVWYDRINGMLDPSGTSSYSTDGSASVSIRSTAVGFYAQDITFKNYYNTHELYLESLKISSDSQAVAVLVQADQSYFKNVKFSSYHDTLYAQVGRQFYENCYIEGRTDYIFGYNATAYFEGCVIHTIGAGLDVTNGGYVVATKGSNKGNDEIHYGYIFNECKFEADENTLAGSVSIARGWAEYMAVMVMNSEISGAFSKEVYGNSESKLNDRYTKMNAGPTPSLLLEYNNTGEGALIVPEDNAETTDVNEAEAFVAQYKDTCTVVTDASVALPYADLLTVFGAENGKVKWNETWGGNLEKNATVEFKTLDGTVLATVKSYVGASLTKVQINNVENTLVIPEGYKFIMFASDAEGKTEYAPTALAETNTIYVVLESQSGTKTVELVYSGDAAANPDFTIVQAAAGSSKFTSLEEGAGKAEADGISLVKLAVATDYIETVQFDAVKAAKVELLGGSTATSNTQIFKVEALDAEGNVVATVHSAPSIPGKVLGYILDAEGNKYIEITSDVEFVKVRITATGDRNAVGDNGCSGKNYCPAIVKVTYEVVVAPSEGKKLSSNTYLPAEAAEFSESTLWNDIFYLDSSASGKVWKITANNKNVYDINGEKVESAFRLQSSGKNTMIIKLAEYSGTITLEFYVRSSSSGDTARTITINDGVSDIYTGIADETTDGTINTTKLSVTLECGKDYILTTSNGINFHAINVIAQ